MKNYDQFLNSKNYEIELNEGLFDMFKKLFGKIGQYINKTKGGQEVEKIYNKYMDLIKKEFAKQGVTELNIGDSTVLKKESIYVSKYNNFLNEAEAGAQTINPVDTPETTEFSEEDNANNAKDVKMTVQKLKQKSQALRKIIELYKAKAIKEMDLVLKKYGGSEKNPKLAIIINNKKDQFLLDYLNAEVAYLEKSGDKTLINNVKIERDKLSKDLNARWQNFDKAGDVAAGGQLVANTFYRYNTADGIKTIQFIKPSTTKGKVIAKYLVKEDGIINKEQEFTTDNIDTEFKPEEGKQYNYYSETNNAIIKVTVVSYDESKKELNLKSEKGNSFKGHIGSIRNLVEDEKPAQGTTEKPAQGTTEEGTTEESK